jgi:hypothetical protein
MAHILAETNGSEKGDGHGTGTFIVVPNHSVPCAVGHAQRMHVGCVAGSSAYSNSDRQSPTAMTLGRQDHFPFFDFAGIKYNPRSNTF